MMKKTFIEPALLTTIACCILLIFSTLNSANAQRILVVYYSETGHTELLAREVAKGVESVAGSELRLLPIDRADREDLLWAEGIILGSPVHSGNIAAPVMEFIKSWPFEGQVMKDKLGAAFVTAGGLSAGEETAQMSILRSMLIFNMIVVGGPDWTLPFGASGIMGEGMYTQSGDKAALNDIFLKKGFLLGQRVAGVALKLK